MRTAIEELEGSLETTELNELGDVQITDGNVNQVLAWNATAATFTERWTNQQISSMWLSDEPELIKDGASVFRLSRIEPPQCLISRVRVLLLVATKRQTKS